MDSSLEPRHHATLCMSGLTASCARSGIFSVVVCPVASQAFAKNPWPDNVMGHGTGIGRRRPPAFFSLAGFDAARAARASNSRVVLAEEKELEHRQFLNEIAVV